MSGHGADVVRAWRDDPLAEALLIWMWVVNPRLDFGAPRSPKTPAHHSSAARSKFQSTEADLYNRSKAEPFNDELAKVSTFIKMNANTYPLAQDRGPPKWWLRSAYGVLYDGNQTYTERPRHLEGEVRPRAVRGHGGRAAVHEALETNRFSGSEPKRSFWSVSAVQGFAPPPPRRRRRPAWLHVCQPTAQQATADLVQCRREEGTLALNPSH